MAVHKCENIDSFSRLVGGSLKDHLKQIDFSSKQFRCLLKLCLFVQI